MDKYMKFSEVIEYLRNCKNKAKKCGHEETYFDLLTIIDELKNVETVPASALGKDTNVPTWIPVSKRLPIKELEERVERVGKNVVLPCFVTMYRTVQKRYFDGKDFTDTYGDVCTDWVKAWMPQPEPWKGEYEEAVNMAIAAPEKAPTALDHIHNVVRDDAYRRGYEQGKADAAPKWIPFTADTAPKEDGLYFIKVKNPATGTEHVWIDRYRTAYGEWFIYDNDNNYVSKWMPIPKEE